ncbi:MAG: hypothetical protein JWN32_1949 [Solirubrobacterales bacterium]|nr:hypothetical protein [Solirubrobacterales bacterium]
MRRLGTLFGLVLAGASLVAFSWALYHLIRTGTCASGGPYISARPCPKGTGGHILGLMGGIFGTLIAVGVWYGSRAADRTGPGLGIVVWVLGFTLAGAAALLAAIGPAHTSSTGSTAGGIIVGAIFIPMGLAGLFGVASSARDSRSSSRLSFGTGSSIMPMSSAVRLSGAFATAPVVRPPAPTSPAASPGAGGTGDMLSRLERLAELHGEGALTDAEFEAQKRKLLGES